MNIFECEIVADEEAYFLKAEEFSHPLSAHIAEKVLQKAEDRKAIAGIRPTDVHVSREKMPGYPEVEVYVSEPLGSKEILILKKGNLSLQTKIRLLPSKVGEKLWVRFDQERLHFFDKATNTRIGISH
jgi:ABC-type sugar transport system ATPase subunit